MAEYDINSYAEYRDLKEGDRPLFDSITDKIRTEEQEWNLLFVGFDNVGRPHIFVITEYGKIQWCDAIGFATIGSGAWTAQNALARFGFNRFMQRGEAAFGLLAAKFASEAADAVGETTWFLQLSAGDPLGKTVAGISKNDIQKTKTAWKEMPKVPDGAAGYLEEALTLSEQEPRRNIDDPLKGYITRSVSRKSKRVP